ncbi:MAG: VPLPA-CTERM sorting domain-containing protein [Pseudomonadota bacterium]
MVNFKALAIAAALAVFAPLSANAAIELTDEDGGPVLLSIGNAVNIENDDLTSGPLAEGGSFDVDTNVFGAGVTLDVQNSSGETSGIRDLLVTFTIAGLADQEFTITDATGEQILDNFFLNILPGVEVFFSVAGEVFEGSSIAQAEYNIFIDPVPLPAAGLIFLTGLAGLGLARRRKVAA